MWRPAPQEDDFQAEMGCGHRGRAQRLGAWAFSAAFPEGPAQRRKPGGQSSSDLVVEVDGGPSAFPVWPAAAHALYGSRKEEGGGLASNPILPEAALQEASRRASTSLLGQVASGSSVSGFGRPVVFKSSLVSSPLFKACYRAAPHVPGSPLRHAWDS